ncbi:MAG: tetratricopeptide repeat protein [Candidatus Omnitrophota bacterium]
MMINKRTGPWVSWGQKVSLLILSAVMTLLILEAGLRVGGAVYGAFQERRNHLSMKQKGVYRILCLGESTTAYFRVKTPYPVFLEEILNQASVGLRFSVINKGVVGTGTSDIVANLEKNIEVYKPDMVIAMMGINDCGFFSYKVRPSSGPEFFWTHFRVYNFLKLMGCRVIKKMETIRPAKAMPEKIREAQRVSPAAEELRTQRGHEEEKNARQGASVPSCEEDPLVKEGLNYQDQGHYALAEKSFKKALSNNADNGYAWLKLGWLHQKQGAFPQAEESFKQAIQIHPGEANAYFGLADASREQGEHKYPQAEESFKKAIELDPYNAEYHFFRGFYYRDQVNKDALAEECFKKALDLMDEKYVAYRELGRTYIKQGKFQAAEALFNEFQMKYPENDRIQQDLIRWLEKKGQSEKAVEVARECFGNVTAKNYIKMEEILSEKKIRFVCVSYPMRDSAPLREIFKGKRGILFVDNGKTFKAGVSRDSYREYFIDKMFGDFGHCTEKGNRLLAENIAKTLLKEAFSQ